MFSKKMNLFFLILIVGITIIAYFIYKQYINIISLFIILTVFAIYDIFNNREIPDHIVYISFVISFILFFISSANLPLYFVITILIIEVLIFLIGFFSYSKGKLGAGDFFELGIINLALPYFNNPIILHIYQIYIPFVLNVIFNTGYIVSIIIPFYYLVIQNISKKRKTYILLYALIFFLFITLLYFDFYMISLILLLAFSLYLLIKYANLIKDKMVFYLMPNELEEDDMIAYNMLDNQTLELIKSKYPKFSGRANKDLLFAIKDLNIKIPVYRYGIPLAFYLLIGSLFSLLFGNLLLLPIW